MTRKLGSKADFYNRILFDRTRLIEKYPTSLSTDGRIPLIYKYRTSTHTHTSHSHCLYTGRPKAIHNKFKMSRMPLKFAMYNGFINGTTKYSW